MVKLLVEFLQQSGIDLGFFRLMEYVTFRIIMTMVTALLINLIFGHRLIVFLYRRNLRDTSGDFLSINAYAKKGTPTAGGLLILAATLVSFAIWGDYCSLVHQTVNPFVICLAAGFVYFSGVGFLDDFQKIRLRSSLSGLSQKTKTLLQLCFIVPFALVLSYTSVIPLDASVKTYIYLPFYKYPVLNLGYLGFAIFVIFTFFSVINAVNITDGMDGLLGGLSILTIGVYGLFAYIIGNALLARHYLFHFIPGIAELTVFGAALVGAVLGFLWYNFYPAEVFMGDTGSLAIGSAIAMMLFFTKQEMLFLVAGGVFVTEIFSSLLQEKVGGRLGRRLLYRAPLHHSLTHRGIAEPKAVARLLISGLLMTMLALLSIKVR